MRMYQVRVVMHPRRTSIRKRCGSHRALRGSSMRGRRRRWFVKGGEGCMPHRFAMRNVFVRVRSRIVIRSLVCPCTVVWKGQDGRYVVVDAGVRTCVRRLHRDGRRLRRIRVLGCCLIRRRLVIVQSTLAVYIVLRKRGAGKRVEEQGLLRVRVRSWRTHG
jgi:hypothetical protein